MAKRPPVTDEEVQARKAALLNQAMEALATKGVDLRGLSPQELRRQLKLLKRAKPRD
jgi:hypothetical protein